jgi:hypothetical protein
VFSILYQEEERKRLENENKTMISDELEKMKFEVEHGKAEIQVRMRSVFK